MEPPTQSSDSKVWAAVLALGLEDPVSGDAVAVNAYSRLPAEAAPQPGARDQLPDIAGYRIVSRLGEGGMGTVWRAVQLSTHREVALKLMTAGRFGSERARQRFEREIELAARLEHPHIARVYDSGSCGGLWYYAMELIEGVNLDGYVAEQKLDHPQILLLMRDVCQAVHYAHQRGVIHRDIKPSNILVDSQGHAHVVDFGLAKALAEEPGDLTLTQEGQYAGTPAFMSPEQAAGKHDLIDTRADVYGLGATLYLLLTDHTPHAMSGPRYEVLRRIANEDVRAPRQMNRSLDVEIESLLLKALAHDPEQRYGSAEELAQDIGRFLSGDALNASPPSKTYRLRKFARKHRTPFGIAAGFAVLLIAATVVSTWQAIRATRAETSVVRERDQVKIEKQRADNQTDIALAVIKFLNKDVLGQASSYEQDGTAGAPDRDLKVRDALDRAADRIGERFDKQPLVEAAVRNTLGQTYLGLGEHDKAEEHLQKAVELNRQWAGAESIETLQSMSRLAGLLMIQGRMSEAQPMYLKTLEGQRRVLGIDNQETLTTMNELGQLYMDQGQYSKAEPLLQEALAGARRVLGDDDSNTLGMLDALAQVYHRQTKYVMGEPLYVQSLEGSRKLHGAQNPKTLVSMNNLALMYSDQGEYAKAEPIFLEAVEGWRKTCGEQHPETLAVLGNLGVLYELQGRYTEAEPILLQVLEGRRKVLGDQHPATLFGLNQLGLLYRKQHRYDRAEAIFKEALKGAREVLGDQHPKTLTMLSNLAQVYFDQARYDNAEPLFAEAYRLTPQSQGDPKRAARVASDYGQCLTKLGRYDEAEAPLREAYQRMKSFEPVAHAKLREVVAALAEVCTATNRPDEAGKWRAELAVLQASTQPPTAPSTQPATDSAPSAPR